MPNPIAELRDRYLAAQLSGDRSTALTLLDDAIAHGFGARDLGIDVIGAAQHEVGRLWQENRLSVAEEHAATAISQYALAHLYRYLGHSPRNGCSVLLACVEGEMHDMGPRIAGDLLDAYGYSVRFLGANVPLDHLVNHVVRAKPDVVALSATMAFHLPALRRAIDRIHAEADAMVPIVVGGHAMLNDVDLGRGVHVAGGTARDLVYLVDRLLEVVR